MSSKCDNCNKNFTKAKPGLECHRCEKIVHLTTLCAGLTNKQLTALRATDNLEWTCQECQEQSPKRRSIIIPDVDEDEDDRTEPQNVNIDIKQLLRDISKEMEKAIKREMKDITQSLQFHSDKMEELIKNTETMRSTITDLQKKNVELTNKNNNLEVRVGALEQRIHETEQRKLDKCIEIHNLPSLEGENINELVGKLAKKANLATEDILLAKRLPGKNDRPGPVHVELQTELVQSAWLAATKTRTSRITVMDVLPEVPASKSNENLFVCEALTPFNKHLLWFAKKELKDAYRYIWIKKGVLRVRKDGENQKAHIVRAVEDVQKLIPTYKSVSLQH